MKKIVNRLVVFMMIMVCIFSLSPSEVQASVKKAASVKLSETSLTLSIGEAKILTASILPVSVTNKTLSWSSSDTKIVSVNKKGKVKAIAPGDATITVKTSNGKKASCEVTVVGYLDRMLYSSYTSDLIENTYSLYEGKDRYDNECNRAMQFYAHIDENYYTNEMVKTGVTRSTVTYELGSKFDTFSCTLTHGYLCSNANIKILGDGKVLYIATWTGFTQPMDLNLDVQGVQELSIEIENTLHGNYNDNSNSIIFSNAKFEKE